MSNWPILNSELEYNFIDVSQDHNRRSEVWQYFWLDRKRAVARCKPCLDKGTSKILVVANGTTKSLQQHIDRFHKERKNDSKSNGVGQMSKSAQAHTFTKRKILGYHITKLAIQGISFRAISSQAMCELMSVSLLNQTNKDQSFFFGDFLVSVGSFFWLRYLFVW